MNRLKAIQSNRGVTLIALIITIIILIILAGISINMLLGENAIITKTKNAKKQYEISTATEEIKLALLEEQMNKDIGANLDGKFNYDRVWDSLRKNDSNLNIEEDSAEKCYYIIYKGFKFKIDENNNVTYIEDSEMEKSTTTIIYVGNGGTYNTQTEIVENVSVNSSITLAQNQFTRDMYEFVCWVLPNGTECSAGSKYNIGEEPIILTAKWNNKISREMDYLVTTGNQYIDTDFKPNQDTTIEMKYQLLSRKTQFLFGTRTNEMLDLNAKAFSFLKHINSKTEECLRTDYNNEMKEISYSYDGIHILKKDKEKTYIDDVLQSTNTTGNFVSQNNLILFNVNTGGTINNNNAKLKFYYCKIWDNGTLIRDFIPIKDSKNKICLYDKQNNKIYYANYGEKQEEFLSDEDLLEIPIVAKGSQYIDTDIKANSNTKIEMKCKINNQSKQFLFGGRTDDLQKTFSCVYLNGNTLRFDYGTTQTPYTTYNVGNVYTITMDKGDFYVGNNKLGSVKATFNCDYNLYLCAVNKKGETQLPAYITLYYCKIWNNDSLIRDFVPTLDSNNKYCLYDKVEQKYYYSNGGDFVLSTD